jgi:hypothetical protein
MSYAVVGVVLVFLLVGTLYLYYPPFRESIIPRLSDDVTKTFHYLGRLATNSTGYGTVEASAAFNTIENMNHLKIVASVNPVASSANLQFKADLLLEGLTLSIPLPKESHEGNVTLFEWDIPIPNPIPTPIPVKADVLLTAMDCGPCSSVVLQIPIDISITMG